MSSNTRRAFLERLAGATAVMATMPRRGLSAEPVPALPKRPALPTEDYWIELKRQFTFPAAQIPMNAANMCPGPRTVVEAVARAVRDVDADTSYQNRSKYNDLRETTRERVARMLNVATDEIALVRNATEANNIVVGGIDLKAGDEVLVIDQNHASNGVAWDVRGARQGFTVKRISFANPPGSVDEVVDFVTKAFTDKTRVLAFSDVSNGTGLRMPATALCRVAKGRGIYVHVDGAQTCGALTRDLREVGCDSYSASGQKWLMGPREIGLLYVRSERIAAMWPGVIGVGWGNGVETTVKGARKFEILGQRNDAATAGLAAALDFHEQIGIEQAEPRIKALSTRLRGLVVDAGFEFTTPKPADLFHGVIVIKAEPSLAQRWHERLYVGHNVITSPTGGLRLSPNLATTLDDMDRAVAALVKVKREVG